MAVSPPEAPPENADADTEMTDVSSSDSSFSDGQDRRLGGFFTPPVNWPGPHPDDSFTYDELIHFGAIDLPRGEPVSFGDLHGPIHPILHHSRWFGMTVTDHENILPALRLVTNMLEAPHVLAFFYMVCFSPRTPLPAVTAKYGVPCTQIPAPTEGVSPSGIRLIKQYLVDAASLLFFAFGTPSNEDGATFRFLTVRSSLGGTGALMRLHYRLYAALVPGRNWAFEQLLRCQLFLATTILHELAHAMNCTAQPIPPDVDPATMRSAEPFVGADRQAELGRALEQVFFGGVVDQYAADRDSTFGLVVQRWPDLGSAHEYWPNGDVQTPERRAAGTFTTVYLVPMTYVKAVHTQLFWRRVQRFGASETRVKKTVGRRRWNQREASGDGVGSDESSLNREASSEGRVGGRLMAASEVGSP
ncbi:MAG: hypothetical protein M1833_000339 [Piccolia ochrophora]|nr:MAG: hypothetical protein M1833_000339 [Piccolia ochrophora]